MNNTDDMVQAQASPSPKLPQGVSELQDEISAIMERWREVGGGVYAVGGCSLEIAKHVLEAALSAQPTGEAVEIEFPHFHQHGMGCGLEDRGITDRYEAMRYGFDEALEAMAAILESYGPLYTAPQPAAVPDGWHPIETAPKDNKRPLWIAQFNRDTGELIALDWDASWEREQESWEMPQVYYNWSSANGNVDEPTHWAYQESDMLPPAVKQQREPEYDRELIATAVRKSGLVTNSDKWQVADDVIEALEGGKA